VHPLAVVLAIATGIVMAGIIGGLLSVPLVAMANTAIRSLLADDPEEAYEEIADTDPSEPMFPAAPNSPHPENQKLSRGEVDGPAS
jgi:hypothetical protein